MGRKYDLFVPLRVGREYLVESVGLGPWVKNVLEERAVLFTCRSNPSISQVTVFTEHRFPNELCLNKTNFCIPYVWVAFVLEERAGCFRVGPIPPYRSGNAI